MAFNASLYTRVDVCVNILSAHNGRVVYCRRDEYLSCAFYRTIALGRDVVKPAILHASSSPAPRARRYRQNEVLDQLTIWMSRGVTKPAERDVVGQQLLLS